MMEETFSIFGPDGWNARAALLQTSNIMRINGQPENVIQQILRFSYAFHSMPMGSFGICVASDKCVGRAVLNFMRRTKGEEAFHRKHHDGGAMCMLSLDPCTGGICDIGRKKLLFSSGYSFGYPLDFPALAQQALKGSALPTRVITISETRRIIALRAQQFWTAILSPHPQT